MSSLIDLLFPSTRQKALAELLLHPGTSFHLRELARATANHAGTLARELDKLAATGLILRREQGNQVRYGANVEHPLYDDLASMFRKTLGIAPLLRSALAPVDERIVAAFVFGSIARGTENEGSDIDVLVLGDLDFAELARALYPLQATLRREINPVLYGIAEFAARLARGDAFAKDLMDKPKIWIKGNQHDLAELVGDTAPAGTRR